MSDETPSTNEEQVDVFNFSWWVCMLPFIAAAGWFVFQWYHARAHDLGNLGIALACIIAGLVISAAVTSAEADKAKPDSTEGGKSSGPQS